MSQFLPFMLFAFVASITPGPTNILVLTNSSRHGWAAAVPIVFGACGGAAALVLLVGTGIGDLLVRHQGVQLFMMWAGIAWLSWMAWQIFNAPAVAIAPGDNSGQKTRLGLIGAASLQLINPKTWMMALAVVSVFAGTEADRNLRVVYLSLLFFIIAIPCMTAWAWLGVSAARWCSSPTSLRRLNQSMAILLLISTWMTVWV